MLQAKGGVGKTTNCLMLIAFLADRIEQEIVATAAAQGKPAPDQMEIAAAIRDRLGMIDTDPANNSLQSLCPYDWVEWVEIAKGRKVNLQVLDTLVETLAREQKAFVIDNGGPSFAPMADYFVANEVPDILREQGFRTVIHTVIVGGVNMLPTLNGMDTLCRSFPEDVPVVVWLNKQEGPIETDDGTNFWDLPAFKHNEGRIRGVVEWPELTEETVHDLRTLISRKQTLHGALRKDNRKILLAQRARLHRLKEALWPQIAKAV